MSRTEAGGGRSPAPARTASGLASPAQGSSEVRFRPWQAHAAQAAKRTHLLPPFAQGRQWNVGKVAPTHVEIHDIRSAEKLVRRRPAAGQAVRGRQRTRLALTAHASGRRHGKGGSGGCAFGPTHVSCDGPAWQMGALRAAVDVASHPLPTARQDGELSFPDLGSKGDASSTPASPSGLRSSAVSPRASPRQASRQA